MIVNRLSCFQSKIMSAATEGENPVPLSDLNNAINSDPPQQFWTPSYQNDKSVGFFMWVSETPERVSIWRFMVDQRYQKAGIGRTALNLALNEIKTSDKLKEIKICYDPENPVAKDFYSSVGFQEVGLDEDGEDMLAVIKL